MTFEDKSQTCKDCGRLFVFTGSEQVRFALMGYKNAPSRCFEKMTAKPTSFCRRKRYEERKKAVRAGSKSLRHRNPKRKG